VAVEKWTLDPVHSNVGFWVRHLMISKVHGRFAQFSGSLEFDPANPGASRVEATIDTASIDTKDAGRDGHLKSPDFFDVEKYPNITFKSTAVEAAGEGNFKVKGDLTLHGVTHPVTLDVEYAGTQAHPQGGTRVGFSAHTAINRKDYGVTFNMALEAGGVALSDKVEIDLDIQGVKVA
jgi:polyisoprenoid-binding protein YceI